MSLSPLVSFKSRFVTYLLNFPRIIVYTLPANNSTLSPTHRGNRHRHIPIYTPLRVLQSTCGADT